MSKRKEIREMMENLALEGVAEMRHFLATYRNDDPVARARVQVATNGVTSYTRQCSSENNMIGMTMAAAERTGVSAAQTLEIVKAVGLLPEAVEVLPPLKLKAGNRRK